MNSATNNAPRTRSDLVTAWKRVSRSLADERISDRDADALRRERDLIQAEIDAIDSAK